MTVRFITSKLTNDTWVIIKDKETGKILHQGYASASHFEDIVKDWDFSKGHIIYI